MNPKDIVASGYDSALGSYARLERSEARWPRTTWLRRLLAKLAPGSAVLDLGCATGVPTAAEIAKQHRVVGIDISPHQIEQARSNVPQGTFISCDAALAEFEPNEFDAVVSLYTFDHIPRDEHRALLERVFGWLRPGGWLLLSIEDSDQPGVVSRWLDVDMYFSMFDAATTRRLVVEAGFELELTDIEVQQEQDSSVSYVWILARKPTPAQQP